LNMRWHEIKLKEQIDQPSRTTPLNGGNNVMQILNPTLSSV